MGDKAEARQGCTALISSNSVLFMGKMKKLYKHIKIAKKQIAGVGRLKKGSSITKNKKSKYIKPFM